MAPTPEEGYHDARPTVAERRFVKRLLGRIEKRLSSDALMFLAEAAEYLARRKRALEEVRGW